MRAQRPDSLLRIQPALHLGEYVGARENTACNKVEKIFFAKAHQSFLKKYAISEQHITDSASGRRTQYPETGIVEAH